MVAPTAAEVVAFLAPEEYAVEKVTALAESHLPIVTTMVRSYVRDNGFVLDDPRDDLAHVIVSSTARLVQNPRMMTEDSHGIDDASSTKRLAVFNGWTLPELAVLNRYRKRAM